MQAQSIQSSQKELLKQPKAFGVGEASEHKEEKERDILRLRKKLGKEDTAWLSDGTNLPVPPAEENLKKISANKGVRKVSPGANTACDCFVPRNSLHDRAT